MKKTFKKKGGATLELLRDSCFELGVKRVGCQMTMDVFGFTKDDLFDSAAPPSAGRSTR